MAYRFVPICTDVYRFVPTQPRQKATRPNLYPVLGFLALARPNLYPVFVKICIRSSSPHLYRFVPICTELVFRSCFGGWFRNCFKSCFRISFRIYFRTCLRICIRIYFRTRFRICFRIYFRNCFRSYVRNYFRELF